MTRILALETAGESCSVALLDDSLPTGQQIRETFEIAPRKQTELALPMVESMLGEAGLTLKDMDCIAFGHGPGAFTGVRVAAAVAQGLAFSADLPVVGVSTLAACALSVPLPESSGQVIACFDARMGEVYLGAYRVHGNQLDTALADGLFKPDALPALDGQWLIAGSGLVYQEALTAVYDASACVPDAHPHAHAVAQLALLAFQRGEAVSAEQAQPVYLRDQVIQGAVR
ncbi:tRNA (adenosine(37)-N6)-threonylcarbamoyltransferase complex dimerization subunit type 1 TsaB [Alcanivorax sp. DP30]|uniref:tRNA (adenosine(37)-N6)-threonylcarbamoyltransferase complex dimerization subunit type 1 TsaB n=1 Tax=Alcanivorax sp. DP30 TaxID=2606217 RepID=UPI001370955C|nr:tRNA (adenosine(37)-N6)-threonylcarbamoyltransferase complex dimerization subunit type 1 TsaB [Alcanivorax sp. DP30]MZR61965.1 tRNA (adenosine(37)-N6)-threonylcarbamoyltransferase complex dimerization subunit type 1 TsaB [Alcanivorax sp. DP30]